MNVALVEEGDIVQTGADEKYKLSTSFTDLETLEFALEGYVTQTFPADIAEGGTLTQDTALVAV